MVSVRWVPDLILCLDCLEVSLEECEDVCVCVCMKNIQSCSCGAEHLWQVCMGRISAVLDLGLKMFLIYLILSYSVHHLSHTSHFSFSPLNLQFCTDTGGEQSHCRGGKKLSECDFWSKAKSLPFLFFSVSRQLHFRAQIRLCAAPHNLGGSCHICRFHVNPSGTDTSSAVTAYVLQLRFSCQTQRAEEKASCCMLFDVCI